MRIVLISCVKKKRDEPSRARDMYVSPLFVGGGVKYAKTLNYDKLFILSAKYGLLEPDTVIKPYNRCLNDYSEYEKKIWAYEVIKKMQASKLDLDNDEFIILAGKEYRKYLCRKIRNYTIPLEGMSLYRQISFLSKY